MTDEERGRLVEMIAADPTCGVLLEGTGGLRKVRFAIGSKGKSGGVRVVYFFFAEGAPICLLEVFAKGEKANLTKAERNELASVSRRIAEQWS